MPINCTTYGIPDEGSPYSRPLPAVGLYVAGASFICFLGLSADLYRSLRSSKLWVASSTFPLNAATLTLLAVATKLPSDITTAMPGAFDQLTKISSIVLVCVVMKHVMPSLGLMSGGTVISNVVALGILVVTLSVNVWIQLYTGIVSFTYFNLIFTICMMLLFFLFVSHALAAATIMRILEDKYDSKHRKIANEMSGEFFHNVTSEWLAGYLNKYWLMALTSSPDYVMRCMTTSIVSSMICYVAVWGNFLLAVVWLPTNLYRHGGGGRPCMVMSAYSWSIYLVFSAQAAAIVVGMIVSVLRSNQVGLLGISLLAVKDMVRIEKYWVQILVEWREKPLHLNNRAKLARKIANALKNSLLLLSLIFQTVILFLCRAFLFLFMFYKMVSVLLPTILIKKLSVLCRSPSSVQEEENQPPDELIEYVLQLEYSMEVVPPIKTVKRWWKNPQKWMTHGRGNQPNHLLLFLKQHPEGSTDMIIPNLTPEELLECWALRMATLATIASTAMRGHRRHSELLMCAVQEGITYAKFVEKNLDATHPKSTLTAADMVWEGVVLYHRWLDVDLDESVAGEDGVKKLKHYSGQYNWEDLANASPLKWPPRMLAAYCMNKAASSIVQDDEGGVHEPWETVLGWLEGAIATVLRDCLRRLPRAIVRECYRGRLGEREEGVREAAVVLGEVERVLSYLDVLQASEESSSVLG